MHSIRKLLCLLVLSLLSAATPASAENLATVKTLSLPHLTGVEPLRGMVAIDNRLVAIGTKSAAIFNQQGNVWEPTPWGAVGELQTAATGSGQAFALLGASGASGKNGASTEVQKMRLKDGRIELDPLPALPEALTAARASAFAARLYVAGQSASGQSRVLYIEPAAAVPKWTVIDSWPGAGAASSAVAQTSALFVTVKSLQPDAASDRMLRWSVDKGWKELASTPGRIVADFGRAMGQAHVLYLVQKAGEVAPKLWMFHTVTHSWASLATMNAAPAATADAANGIAAAWKNGIVWQHGSATSGNQFDFSEVESGKVLLKWLDWIVLIVYLISMLGMGLYFYLREKRNSTSDFFVGGRSIPFWAAGVSLYAANTSSISYIAIPAKAFETNWQYMTNNLVAVVGLMFVAVWIVPLLRRLDLMSVFSYLETRFHPAIRMLASGLFILVQLGSRMSVILFLPSLAIATITGIDVVWSILMMGGFTIIYTALGGMKAVVWTDIVQLVVKMGGAVFAIGFMIYSLDGGLGEFLKTAAAEDKTKLFDFSFDLTKATVWGFIFLVLFDVVLTFPKDQVLMQRTLSTKSDKDAGRSIWAFAAIMIPGGFIFYTIGTALFVFYKANPGRMNPLLPIDATFPLFIAAELPMGVTGLIVAGIFAAAMATLSSIMNSVSTVASVDFYEKLVLRPDPAKCVRFAEWMTVVAGLLGIGCALLLSRYDIHSLFDVSIELAGLLGGGFAGAYTLGMFTRRANSPGVAIGAAASITLTTIAWFFKLVHPYFYLAISIMLCIVIGYVASLFFPAPTRSLKGLTIYDQDKIV